MGWVDIAKGWCIILVVMMHSATGGFNQAAEAKPEAVRKYFAWGQGFMSGAMIRAQSGIDEELDLSSNALTIAEQMLFISRHCGLHVERHFADAIQALYRALGGKGM